jgi:hypothetical protein
MNEKSSDATSQAIDQRPLLFISHRHVDSKIADVLREFVNNKSLGSVAVYQSSSASGNSPQIGTNLNQQLIESLKKTNVLILVYTTPDQDWSYCMWECGLALDPSTPPTRIILFQCAGYSPAPFLDQVKVNIRNQVDIQKFTNDFLTSETFFPKHHRKIAPFLQPNGPEVVQAANELYVKLQEVAPSGEDDPSEEWPAWPFLQLELSLEQVDHICKAQPAERLQVTRNILQNECLISEGDREAAQLFGITGFPRNIRFQKLIDTWKEETCKKENFQPELKWLESLCSQIVRGAQWRFPNLQWELMQGAEGHNWYAPVLNRVRKIPSRKCMQFDVYFYKFQIDPDSKSVNVGIPSE